MKLWQYLALISGAIITAVMALASISYSATLATPDAAFRWLPVTNTIVFSLLALALELGMIASVFGFLQWLRTNRAGTALCAALFVIASLCSIHSVRGYIALNVTKSLAPAARSADVYASLKLELDQAQAHLAGLRAALLKARRRERDALRRQITQTSNEIEATRKRLFETDNTKLVSPLAGLEWFLAVTLWFFNATCWTAWFGHRTDAPPNPHDTVSAWLLHYDFGKPEHCAALYDRYKCWCETNRHAPLAQYSFYGRLVELGAHKFRDGRNGPTKYALPKPIQES